MHRRSPLIHRGPVCKTGQAGWQKILYVKQPYPDNYVDENAFLSSLVTNENLHPYDYWAMVHDSASVIQVISAIALFGLVFNNCWAGTLDAPMLLAIDAGLCVVAGTVRGLLSCNRRQDPGPSISSQQLRSGLILLGVLLGLTPILRSLTQAYSDDTILLLSIICLGFHALSQDYAFMTNYRERFNGIASLNLAIFATVMLASRLETNAKVLKDERNSVH